MTVLPPRHQRPSKLPGFLFGVPYYPEQWRPEDRKNDAAMMAAAGVNVVRMAEFAWDRMEPRPGAFDFSIFDETIDVLGAAGIETILCTPTAAPPRWMTSANPDWFRENASGVRMTHGSRQHVCTNHPEFRAASERITRAMAEHYRDNPRVIGWQTDNEFFCHISECFCPACGRDFQRWLREKYGNIQALNEAWGAAFWAQTYGDFSEIVPPRQDRPTYPNPGAQLDWFRFLGDAIRDFQGGQVNILRSVQPRWWITHNGTFQHVDYWNLAEDLDFLGVDVYPGFTVQKPEDYWWAAVKNEEARSASGSYIIPEQQAGAGGQWPYLHRTPDPGQMRLWAWQAVAHGADGILHFRWRTCRYGAEMYWNGVLDHDNIPRRRYDEFAREGGEFARLGDSILGTTLSVKVGVLLENDQDEAHQTMPMGLPSPDEQRRVILRELLRRKLEAGYVNAHDSFEGLGIIILPGFVLMDEDLAARLGEFVERGGLLVATARTATRHRNNHVSEFTPPGFLRDVFGATVEEFGKLERGSIDLEMAPGVVAPVGDGYEILSLRGARALGNWQCSRWPAPHAASGLPAVSHHVHGSGSAIYLGTYISADNAAALIGLVLDHANIPPLAVASDGVEITCRHSASHRLYFLLNHSGQPASVSALPVGTDLITGQPCDGDCTLSPFGVALIKA
ncbi:beta-galactosidase [Terrimicrobium sacchariphilum]|nr:beta-galactosidase [Terrimicrobium sacchariphilum]